MKKGSRALFTIIMAIIVGVIITAIVVGLRYIYERTQIRDQVLAISQAYIEQTYQQEMVYIECENNRPEGLWGVYYSPRDNPELVFCVILCEEDNRDIAPKERVSLEGYDTYYDDYFAYELEKRYKSDVEAVWGVGTKYKVYIFIYQDEYDGLDEFSTIEDAQDILNDNYLLIIKGSYCFERKNIDEIARKMWDILEKTQQDRCRPNSIAIDESSTSINSKKRRLSINYEFETLSQIIEYLEKCL